MIYLYAFIDGYDRIDEALTGVGEERVEILELESIAVAAGTMAGQPALSKASLAAQDRVVRELQHVAAAVLPLRFGSAFAAQDDAARAIRTRHAALIDGLALVRNREQMTLRITGPVERDGTGAAPGEAPDDGRPTSGLDYLRRRAAAATPAELRPLLDALSKRQRGTRIETGRAPGVVATIYQLIDRGASEPYRQAVRDAAIAIPALTIRVAGPSPCYAFA